MGKTTKFLRSLLGFKKSPPESSSSAAVPSKEKKKKKSKCALSKSADFSKFKNEDPLASPYVDGMDANKHAIAVAAATAAVAEAALAAAQAAAEVVRLTSGGERHAPAYVSHDRRRVGGAVVIQSAFRAYLARRALRALKGLVKLQALVRGHIVRKQTADMLRRMQAMARIQARASATRSHYSINYSGAANPRNYHPWSDNGGHMMMQPRTSTGGSRETSKWLSHWMEQYSTSRGDDERSDKILEIDTWKPRRSHRAFSGGLQKNEKRNPSVSSEEKESDQVGAWTAESSPRVHSASSRPTSNARGATRSLLGDYLSHPSYMANTESSRAKARSQSAPKQRMIQLDESAWESDAVSYLKRRGTHTRGATNNTLSYGYTL